MLLVGPMPRRRILPPDRCLPSPLLYQFSVFSFQCWDYGTLKTENWYIAFDIGYLDRQAIPSFHREGRLRDKDGEVFRLRRSCRGVPRSHTLFEFVTPPLNPRRASRDYFRVLIGYGTR